ncbi:hypothetical protein ACFL00_04385 [Pseudomonadota bacterium]
MRRMTLIARCTLTLCLALAGAPGHLLASETADRTTPTLEELTAHNVRRLDYWKGFETRSLADRLQPATPEVIDFLQKSNLYQGFPQQPVPARIDKNYLADIRAAIKDIPAAVQALVADKLVALMLVEDLGGSGYMESVLDANGEPVAAFLVLDPTVLDKNANAWASWKDSTPFMADPEYEIRTHLEEPVDDTRQNALRYILLHEFAHFVGMDPSLNPNWWQEPSADALAVARFASLSWVFKDGEYVSRYDSDFTLRPRLVFYGSDDSKLPMSDAAPLLRELSKTNFPTPYAATSNADDFAESLANYIHVVVDKRPYWVEVTRNGQTLYRLESCWGTPRCATKEMLLSWLLAAPKKL